MKMNQSLANETWQAVQKALDLIPSHRASPKEAEEIAQAVAGAVAIPYEMARGIAISTLIFLDTFGVISWRGNCCRIADQIQDYFRHSLSWYIANHQQLMSNWERPGTAREMGISNLLEKAPYFLKLMEERRLALSRLETIEPGYSRVQAAAIILIKCVGKGKTYFLHQWDDRAEQYQLLGGRQRTNEHHFDTAKRELQEEISEHELVYGRDYELMLLNEEPVKVLEVSRTYGALTAYEFWLYHAKLKMERLRLSVLDRWITMEEMKKGVTGTGKCIRHPHLCRLFDASIQNGMDNVPPSISVSQTVKHFDFIEIRPRIFGISIDLKGIVQHWLSKIREGRE